MRFSKLFYSSVAMMTLIISTSSCSSAQNQSGEDSKTQVTQDQTQKNVSWQNNMNSLSSTLTTLIPLIYNEKEFKNPDNKKNVSDLIQNLKSTAHKVKNAPKPEGNISLNFISGEFSEELGRIQDAYSSQHFEFARHQLKNLTSYCIECHTKHSNEPQFKNKINLSLNNIPETERPDFYISIRFFDEALNQYKTLLSSQKLKGYAFLKTMKKTLYITVRVKNDPQLTQEILNIIKKQEHPAFVAELIGSWQKSTTAWLQDKRDLHKFSQQNLNLTQKLILSEDIYLIENLRAQSILNDYLNQNLISTDKAQVLYHLGDSIEKSGNLISWNLHENFYQSCIESHPNSPIAQSCFKKLEQSIYFGFSGSSGYHIPENEQQKLLKYKVLSIIK